jgi:hypothetical protein
VRVEVDNSIDGRDDDPNLIVDVIVIDDDSELAASQRAALSGAVRSDEAEAPSARGELAHLALDPDGAPLGIAVVGAGGEAIGWIESDAIDESSAPSWSPDGERLVFVGRHALHLAEPASGAVRLLCALPGASAADWGPALEMEAEGAARTLDVIAAIGTDGAGGLEDVFAIYVGPRGELAGLENLTRTPELRELDVAWLHDGRRLAVLERSERDALVLRDVRFAAGSAAGSLARVHAELDAGGLVLRDAEAGTLRDVSAARSSDLVTLSEWTGRDWDVVCIDRGGGAAQLGSGAIDESAPGWSSDDRFLAVERRCASDPCGVLPVAIWELDRSGGSAVCPRVAGARVLRAAGALPAWRP